MLERLSSAAEDDLTLEAASRSRGFIDLTYQQYKKYQQLIKDGKEPLKTEVYKDHAKFDMRRALFGDEEIRRTLANDHHDGIEFLEKKFGKAFSDEDRVRPPSSTYTFLVREKSAATLRKESKKQRERKKIESLRRKEQKMEDLRLARDHTIAEKRTFLTDRGFNSHNRTDDHDDIFHRLGHNNQGSFLDHLTPKTSPEQQTSSPASTSVKSNNIHIRKKKTTRKRDLPPLDLSLRRLTLRIPSILQTQSSQSRDLHKPVPLPSLSEISSSSFIQFQYPAWRNKKVIKINDDWLAVRERRNLSPPPEENEEEKNPTKKVTTLGPSTVSKWRLFSTEDNLPPQVNVFVHYQPDGKVEVRRKVKAKRKKVEKS